MATKLANPVRRRRQLILGALLLSGRTQAEVARRCGVTRSMVCHVIAGRKAHARVQAALARVCRMSRSELWED